MRIILTVIILKLNRFQKILVWIIGILVSISLILNVVKITTPLNGISNVGYNVFSMFKYALIDAPLETITDFGTSFSSLWKVNKENDDLRKQIDNLASAQAKLNEMQRQINELQDLLKLNEITSNYNYISCTVLTRSQETYNNLLTINVGSDDGIVENQAVITSKGLIGRITNVERSSSIVKLLTTADGNNKVSVKIEVSDLETADAILEKYDLNEKAYLVTLLNANTSITEGMTVVTSGMGGVFPSGLLVGKVKKIEEIPNAVSMNIYVEPSADFDSINYVNVVTRSGE